MPKKRRKLNKELENDIASAKRKVELITAKIFDIRDEDIQGEYRDAFQNVISSYLHLSNLYKTEGFTPESEATFALYKQLISEFEEEYEI